MRFCRHFWFVGSWKERFQKGFSGVFKFRDEHLLKLNAISHTVDVFEESPGRKEALKKRRTVESFESCMWAAFSGML